MQPTATKKPPIISKQVQNQKVESKKKPMTTIDIVAMIPQIIFGILTFISVCFFWAITFADHKAKK
jgi:hypothetical protein